MKLTFNNTDSSLLFEIYYEHFRETINHSLRTCVGESIFRCLKLPRSLPYNLKPLTCPCEGKWNGFLELSAVRRQRKAMRDRKRLCAIDLPKLSPDFPLRCGLNVSFLLPPDVLPIFIFWEVVDSRLCKFGWKTRERKFQTTMKFGRGETNAYLAVWISYQLNW